MFSAMRAEPLAALRPAGRALRASRCERRRSARANSSLPSRSGLPRRRTSQARDRATRRTQLPRRGPPRVDTKSPRGKPQRGRPASPATSEPVSESSPRARAEPSVPSSSASAGVRTSGLAARALAERTTDLSSSKKSNEGAEAGLSVPTPTLAPAARSSASGATPQPSAAFDRGQWATPVPVAARRPISSSSRTTQCAATRFGPSRSCSASSRVPVAPGASTSRSL